MKVKELAEKLGINYARLYRWINKEYSLVLEKDNSDNIILNNEQIELLTKTYELIKQGLSMATIKSQLLDSTKDSSQILIESDFNLNKISNQIEPKENTSNILIDLTNRISTISHSLGVLETENIYLKQISIKDSSKINELLETLEIKETENKSLINQIKISNNELQEKISSVNLEAEKKLQETILRYEETIKILANQLDKKDTDIEILKIKNLELSNEIEKLKTKKKWYQLG